MSRGPIAVLGLRILIDVHYDTSMVIAQPPDLARSERRETLDYPGGSLHRLVVHAQEVYHSISGAGRHTLPGDVQWL